MYNVTRLFNQNDRCFSHRQERKDCYNGSLVDIDTTRSLILIPPAHRHGDISCCYVTYVLKRARVSPASSVLRRTLKPLAYDACRCLSFPGRRTYAWSPENLRACSVGKTCDRLLPPCIDPLQRATDGHRGVAVLVLQSGKELQRVCGACLT